MFSIVFPFFLLLIIVNGHPSQIGHSSLQIKATLQSEMAAI